MLRVLIVDDHVVVRQGLRFMLEQRQDIEVVGECSDGEEAIARAIDLLPDVILLDLLMPKLDGISAIREIKRLMPRVHIVVLSSYYDDDHIYRAIKAGALSYLLKDSSARELVEAVRAAAHGESKLHPTVAARVLHEIHHWGESPLKDLTRRELEVLTLIARGRSNYEIAAEMSIGEPTVRTYVTNILSKLQLADRTQAAIYALQKRLVSLDDALEPGDLR